MRGIMSLLIVHECTRIDETFMIWDHNYDIAMFNKFKIRDSNILLLNKSISDNQRFSCESEKD